MRAVRVVVLTALAAAFVTPALAAPVGRVEICHWDATLGAASVILVSGNAVYAHVTRHGDSYPATYYADADEDGFGDPLLSDRCPNDGFRLVPGTDCDDTNPDISPAATEITGNAYDENCSGCGDTTVSVCPCYTAAEIDAAYVTSPFGVCDQEVSSEVDYTDLHLTSIGAGYHGFYAMSWDPSHPGQDMYCANYANDPPRWRSAFLTAEAEEAACEQVLQDWATCRQFECP